MPAIDSITRYNSRDSRTPQQFGEECDCCGKRRFDGVYSIDLRHNDVDIVICDLCLAAAKRNAGRPFTGNLPS